MSKRYGVLTGTLRVTSRGGFKLNEFPAGTPCIVTDSITFGGNPIEYLEIVDVLGNTIGDYSFRPDMVYWEEREETELEKAYAAICAAKEQMEVMAYAERKA